MLLDNDNHAAAAAAAGINDDHDEAENGQRWREETTMLNRHH